ncbi:MAG: hypothetical protein AAFY48_09795 [Bacteroidota bacterium]
MKNKLSGHLKNTIGWRTKRKLVLFAVDDYGNVRVHSKAARTKLLEAGLPLKNRFDHFDALSTEDDLQALFGVLSSVRDQEGRPAVFTPYSLPANIDFEKVLTAKDGQYHYERLPLTYQKIAGHTRVLDLWEQGQNEGLFQPEFHGREHLSVPVFETALSRRDSHTLTCLENRCYTGLSSRGFSRIKYSVAFGMDRMADKDRLLPILEDGLQVFKEVFGIEAVAFTPPSGEYHRSLRPTLERGGIRLIDHPLFMREHQGEGVYRRVFSFTGQRLSSTQRAIVRNCQFEPTEESRKDWVGHTLTQIDYAFRWNRPAVISSHRVNFCGRIEEQNRTRGLRALKQLLQSIKKRWPDVEFISVRELAASITGNVKS